LFNAKARRREKIRGLVAKVAVITGHRSDDGQVVFNPLRLRAFALENRLYCPM
jgi:hypothetical protein